MALSVRSSALRNIAATARNRLGRNRWRIQRRRVSSQSPACSCALRPAREFRATFTTANAAAKAGALSRSGSRRIGAMKYTAPARAAGSTPKRTSARAAPLRTTARTHGRVAIHLGSRTKTSESADPSARAAARAASRTRALWRRAKTSAAVRASE
jgi:hypothetical protein